MIHDYAHAAALQARHGHQFAATAHDQAEFEAWLDARRQMPRAERDAQDAASNARRAAEIRDARLARAAARAQVTA
jgi:hypothetical protein